MVLNHASLNGSRQEATRWLGDMARGMAALVDAGIVERSLRAVAATAELRSPQGWTVLETCLGLREVGMRDEGLFLLRLTSKAPLLSGVTETIKSRFLGCEALGCETEELQPEAGAPLVFCALNDAISVGIPSEAVWDRDQLTVHFHELLPDGTFDERRDAIDNLTRAAHAAAILERHRARARQHCASGAELWEQREELFPHLLFGREVKGHLDGINVLDKVMRRLAELDESAASWSSGPTPDWLCDVRTESGSVMSEPKLLERRRFPSATGNREVFALHASFGKGGRIHLRVDAARLKVEIGYIGDHLPTKKFPN